MTTRNIRQEIIRNRKILPLKQYKEWLKMKLDEHGVNHDRLLAVVITVERTLNIELLKYGNRNRPYYKLYKDDGKTTRAWIYAAELALFLKYKNFKAVPYVKSIITHPIVKRRIIREANKQVPLSMLFPSTRKSNDRFVEYSRHFRNWLDKRG